MLHSRSSSFVAPITGASRYTRRITSQLSRTGPRSPCSRVNSSRRVSASPVIPKSANSLSGTSHRHGFPSGARYSKNAPWGAAAFRARRAAAFFGGGSTVTSSSAGGPQKTRPSGRVFTFSAAFQSQTSTAGSSSKTVYSFHQNCIMNDLPQRSPRHSSGERGLAILKLKLPRAWICRNQPESDYGIDVEIEVADEKVRGIILKGQVRTKTPINWAKNDTFREPFSIRQAPILADTGFAGHFILGG